MDREAVTRGKMARTFLGIGLTSYGGPAIVAQIRQVTVLRKGWLTEEEFAESLAFCQTLPGPIAVQTAAHIGWRLFGGIGAFIALTCYIFPAFLLIMGLSAAYFRYGSLALVAAVFKGLGAVVAGIVADSILTMARPSLKDWRGVLIAAAAAAGFFAGLNTLLVLAGAAALGCLLTYNSAGLLAAAVDVPKTPSLSRSTRRTLSWVLGLAVFFSAVVWATGLYSARFPDLGLAMIKVNLLAFGGGYTAIALMYQHVVTTHAWLTAKEFIDGLAMGQITPGPVIITATFIGYRVGGLTGSLFSTFCVFWPSSLLMVLLAPQFARVRRMRGMAASLRGLLAAFIAMLLFVFWQVAQASLTGLPTLAMAATGFAALRMKVNPAWVILAAVALSLVFFR
jgi:chromate transporter